MSLIKKYQRLVNDPIVEIMPAVLNTINFPIVTIMARLKTSDLDWKYIFAAIKDKIMDLRFSNARQVELGERFLKDELKNPDSYKKIIKSWYPIEKEFQDFCRNIGKISLNSLPIEELKSYYQKFVELFIEVWTLPLTATNISYHADNVWIPKIIKKYGKKGLEDFTVLSTPDEMSFLQQQEYNLLKIAVSKDYEKLKDHVPKYFWIKTTYRDSELLDVDYFMKKINEIKDPEKELEEFENSIRQQKQRFEKVSQNNEFNEEERAIAKLVAEATTFQDLRKKNNLIGNHFCFRFLQAFAEKTDYTYDELCFARHNEILDILDGNQIDKSILDKRSECVVQLVTPEETDIIEGDKAEEFYNYLQNLKPESDEIKGVTASLGKAKGKVKIIMDASKADDFQEGDILVASMTRPEYTSLMKKASAIITDEGGITCHAAIVSRELGIPCIIGTKNATKLLKDGDLVEVDADNGVVRKR